MARQFSKKISGIITFIILLYTILIILLASGNIAGAQVPSTDIPDETMNIHMVRT